MTSPLSGLAICSSDFLTNFVLSILRRVRFIGGRYN